MLYLVRHGRTAANAAGLLQGRVDHPLDDLGHRQALALADVLPASTRVISSPLLRAVQTAEMLGGPLEVDERWVELDYGEYDGARLSDVPPEVWREWRRDVAFVPPGGESIQQVGRRVASACEELFPRAAEEDVIVVSHVSPLKAAVAWALGVGDEVAWRLWLAPASVTRIGHGPGGPSLRSFNEIGHLPT